MATHVFTPILGKRIRVTKLDSCGRFPDAAEPESVIATDGFITVNLSSEIEDGTEIVQKNASGGICVNEKFANSFKRLNMNIDLCGVSPALLDFISAAYKYADHAGDTAGFTLREGKIEKYFAFELWTGLSGVPCPEGDDVPSGYLLLPFVVGGQLGDIEVGGENAVNVSMTGAYTKGGNTWGTGPFNVVFDAAGDPAPLPSALDPLDHLLLLDTALAYPPSSGEPVEMPARPTTTTTTTA